MRLAPAAERRYVRRPDARGRHDYLDQDALNVCIQDRVRYSSCVWNFMPLLDFTRLQEEFPAIGRGELQPAIIHFAGDRKPWSVSADESPCARRYWELRQQSPWAVETR